VVQNVLEDACKTLNKRFFTFHTRRRPYVILKWAQTADSIIGNEGNERLMITNEITNRLVHKWRAEEAAIVVGTNTALLDDPSLTTRLWKGKNPIRIVLDKNLRLPRTLKLFCDGGKTIVLNSRIHEERGEVTFYKLPVMENDIAAIIEALYQLNIQSVMIEGGRKLIQSFINENCWDEARIITNSSLAATGVSAPHLHHATSTHSEIINSDTIRYYKPIAS
jgi:diaminohydroxyphosphoribosylaminopyrimidine deaminase/5-amino-6-(5-phosphoribosylamino)uracil reductase